MCHCKVVQPLLLATCTCCCDWHRPAAAFLALLTVRSWYWGMKVRSSRKPMRQQPPMMALTHMLQQVRAKLCQDLRDWPPALPSPRAAAPRHHCRDVLLPRLSRYIGLRRIALRHGG
jgi:hypothetical protein